MEIGENDEKIPDRARDELKKQTLCITVVNNKDISYI